MMNVGILIPAYNEEGRLPVEEVVAFLKNPKYKDYKIIFLNDGSSDGTQPLLDNIASGFSEKVETIHFKKNEGKAETVRKGMIQLFTRFEYLGYLDADLATTLDEFYSLAKRAEIDQVTICFGSRIKKLGSRIERSTKRHIIGRVFATLSNSIIKVPVYDTQCGAKLFHQSLVEEIFNERFISKWLFDIEVICRVLVKRGKKYFEDNALEVPLKQWQEKGASKIKLKDFFSFPLELVKIKRRYSKQMKL
jgi:glycosyltransferase involved in cell wall biosynthesis